MTGAPRKEHEDGRGRVYVRKFDWDEARRLRAQGMTYKAIGVQLGVSQTAVILACDGRQRAMQKTYNAEVQRSGQCVDCGRRCSYNPSKHIARCRECSYDAQTTSVRPTSLRCTTCRKWKPDSEFAFSRSASARRRGRHKLCSACAVRDRAAFRERNKVPCEDGCGRMVEGKGRANTRNRGGVRVAMDPNRPYLCLPCALQRIHAERRAARTEAAA